MSDECGEERTPMTTTVRQQLGGARYGLAVALEHLQNAEAAARTRGLKTHHIEQWRERVKQLYLELATLQETALSARSTQGRHQQKTERPHVPQRA